MQEIAQKLTDITTEDYLLIIDGSSLLTTQFFGNLPKEIMFAKTLEEKESYFNRIMHTTTGIYTNAVYGFIRVLLKILKEQHPPYLAITWDISRDTFRRELYPDYKANRGDILVPLRDQFILCQNILKIMNIPQFMDARYEADDFSGSLASLFEPIIPVRIMTKDNDYLQLVTERTHLWMIHSTSKKTEELYQKYNINQKKLNIPDRTFPISPELVKAEFFVEPASINSLKGLQGDPSDNIKGVKGVGEATATSLIAYYGSIETLYNAIRSLDEAGKKKMNEFWKNELALKRSPMNYLLKTSDTELVGEKAAILSKTLATIKRDIDLSDLTLESLKVNLKKEEAQKEFDRLEFKSIKIEDNEWESVTENPFDGFREMNIPFMNLPEEALENKKDTIEIQQEQKAFRPVNFEDINMICVDTKDKLKSTILQIKEEMKLEKIGDFIYCAFSFLVEDDIIYGIAITVSDNLSYYFWIGNDITESDLLNELEFIFDLCPVFSCYQLKKQLPYLKFEYKNYFDVELAAYLINPLKGNYPLSELCEEFLGNKLVAREELLNHLPLSSAIHMDKEALIKVAVYESYAIYHLRERLLYELEVLEMDKLFYQIEMPLIFTLFDMEQRGIKVDKQQLKEYANHLQVGIKQLETDIYQLAEEEFNINSPKQLGIILFEKLKLSNKKKTKTGYSTSADVLEKLSNEHPIINMVLEYRQLTKLKSTYADGLSNYIGEDERIHGTFNQTITATGRISSTEPNLQNIPIKLELGRQIRKVFIPDPDYIFLDADYSQIELRVLAHMSKDKRLIEAYKKAQDIHQITASQVFHTPLFEVTSEQRSNAKAVNFGIVYGISSFGLGQGLNITRSEAEEYINKYFETYPRVKEFLEELIKEGKETGYVTTMFHRKRPVPDLTHANFQKRSAEERIAMNSPIQGSAADIIKIAMIRVNERLKKDAMKSRLLLQIHDELLVETHQTEILQVKKIMEEEMQQVADFLVPLEVEVKQGNNWYEAK